MNIQNQKTEANPFNQKEQTFEKEVDYYNQNNKRVEKIKIQIKFTSDHQIIYYKNEAILRVEQLKVKNNILNNLEQILKLSWRSQYDEKKNKDGKWIAFWGQNDIINVGGYQKDGQKQGLWKDLFKNYWSLALIYETGEYLNDFKIGRWKYFYENKNIGGGLYNNEGEKIGKWIDLNDGFQDGKQVTYAGEYNRNGKKVGKWDIMHCRRQKNQYKQIGGGYYDKEANYQKIGKWVELDELFEEDKKVTYQGEYNINGIKVGKWDKYRGIYSGGGSYDQDGKEKKIGKWIELDKVFRDYQYVIQNGEYNMNGMKIGRWDIMYSINDENQYKQIGGGSYDLEGNQKKIGKWVELDEEFKLEKYVTSSGEYNMNGMKIGRWDIMYSKYGENQYKQIGGGSYDLEGNQKKIGKWVELDEEFNNNNSITYNGEYNINGMKIGRWDKINLKSANKLWYQIKNKFYSGCMNFDEIGNWIYTSENNSILNVGSFQKSKKIGRWDILYCYNGKNQYKQMKYLSSGGGSYNKEGNQNKIGRWVELDEGFKLDKEVIYNGEYNVNGMKVGRWDIYWFSRKLMQILYKLKGNINIEAEDHMIKKEIRKRLESGLIWMKGLLKKIKLLIMVNIM
ncbi:unnamed protein product [Paramecium sonneborni]|uniref:Uncharacterized protein n=1 Tax=Paramecium sonneborni TaxID=65129 RepID=A0A8S1PNX6_9CILI|nr:unnamed protein product [Paramecium sonneborni]